MNPSALFLLDAENWHSVYGAAEHRRLQSLVRKPLRFHTRHTLGHAGGDLAEAEVIFTGWGMPPCNEAFLDAAPKLKAIFYAAGSVRPFITDALWEREIVVSSANAALAASVAEFVLAEILLSLKWTWRLMRQAREKKLCARQIGPGSYGSVVGLISLGAIARQLLKLLRHFNLRVIVYDPYVSDAEAWALGVERVSLDDLFETADVVSLHTPLFPETTGMINGGHFSRMKPDATFINSARGAIVAETEMIEALRRRPDICALLDVTESEPPAPASPLYELPNVFLTPHIAGSLGNECQRLGAMAVDEFERYLKGAPLEGRITREMLATRA